MTNLQASQPTGFNKGLASRALATHEEPREWARGRRALIVEDETLVAWHLESVLQELGFEVCEVVSTGRAAVAEALATEPGIIFMDINLAGEIDGVEAAGQILEKSAVPIVFVTAYSDDEATLTRIHSIPGKSVVVGKPATPAAIEAAILRLQSP